MQWKSAAIAITTAVFGLTLPVMAANPSHVQRLLKSNQCPGCDLRGADLQETNLSGANLVGANLKNAQLNGSNLGSANLKNADLTSADLRDTYLYQTILDQANLSQSNLSGANLQNAVLTDVILQGSKLQNANLNRANLVGVSLQGVDFSGANLSQALLSGLRLGDLERSGGFLSGIHQNPQALYDFLKASNFGTQDLESCHAESRPDTTDPSLVCADLRGANLSNANLRGAILVGADLSHAKLTGANLAEALLTHANLRNAVLDNANLSDANLRGAIIQGASLTNIKNADLSEVYQSAPEAAAGARQAIAKHYIGAMNRAQQAYYVEFNKFTQDFQDLGLGMAREDESYWYEIAPQSVANQVVMVAQAKQKGLRSYIGLVVVAPPASEGEYDTLLAFLCETDRPGKISLLVPQFQDGMSEAQCPPGSHLLK